MIKSIIRFFMASAKVNEGDAKKRTVFELAMISVSICMVPILMVGLCILFAIQTPPPMWALIALILFSLAWNIVSFFMYKNDGVIDEVAAEIDALSPDDLKKYQMKYLKHLLYMQAVVFVSFIIVNILRLR